MLHTSLPYLFAMTAALIFDPIYSQLSLPQGHRFPIPKYQGVYDRLRAADVPAAQFLRPRPLPSELARGPLCEQFIDDFVSGELDPKAVRRIGFPWSEQLARRTFTAVGGTILAGLQSLQNGWAINLSGGYHHAFYDHGSGFCIINDLYLSALNLLRQPSIKRVMIFDCDVHQGDGTASLAASHPQIATVSIHGEKNFPFVKQQSSLDVALPSGIEDDEYLSCLESTWQQALDRFKPDAVIYDAGADVHCDDDLGHFNLSLEGVLARDRFVFEQCARAGLPVSAVIGGGYQRNIEALVDVHFQLFKAALKL